MSTAATVRRWEGRLAWPTIVATLWVVLYASAGLFGAALSGSERGDLGYLLSVEHLTRPLGAVFGLALLVAVAGVSLRVYAVKEGY